MYKKITYDGEDYYLVPEEDMPTNKSVCFVIGHHASSQGAYSVWLKETEWQFWFDYANKYLIGLGDIFIHEPLDSYTERQIEMAKKTENYDLVFELHFNAFPDAEGVETLTYKGNEKMLGLGNYFCELMEEDLGYENRHAKWIDSGNGYGFLRETKGDAILLEPFFGSDEIDCMKFHPDIFAAIINKTIKKYYELK